MESTTTSKIIAQSLPAALVEAALQWDRAGLSLPPVPRELGAKLRQSSAVNFGTESREPDDREAWLEQARNIDAPTSVVLGHSGHGVNSYHVCYQLVRGPLAVFVRLPFGGIYGDTAAEAARFNKTVELLEELIVHADAAQKAGRVKPGQRLIIAVDTDGPTGWELAPSGVWRDSDDPIELVMKAVGPK